ncbi:hypothetical protein CAEBREN_09175 [Caenorhabditis brenneri]|uniref:Mannosyltransferase n=1 Tax=Caenorhabditis brenneri TaxID=135651 RepID=G0MVN1_CAEBE|nr:hypothetical protein CAEBREN_09175 [Caenorhabditis brenneri]
MQTKRRKIIDDSQPRTSSQSIDARIKHGSSVRRRDWGLDTVTVVPALLLVRLIAATYSVINDCDEVYNYWEPLHLFLHKEGFQTWEYSPIYAIRSYFYIYLHYIPAFLFTYFGFSKIAVFTLVRVTLGLFCLIGEFYAYRAICKKINESTGRFFIFLTIFSSGVFQASTAFVPSSFCMALCFYIIGAYLNENWKLGILCVAFSTLVGWPFSAILGLSIVIRMLFVKRLVLDFIVIASVSGVSIGLMQFAVDSYYFGKPVIAPLNIVLYNVLSGPGPSLYGVEPLSYYIKNLIVNWNVAVLPAAFGFLLSVCVSIKQDSKFKKGAVVERISPVVWLTATAALWLAIFGSQPHKEERFLFPVYPFLALFTAIACDRVGRFVLNSLPIGRLFNTVFIALFAILSISRSYSIHVNYGAHIGVYRELNEQLAFGPGRQELDTTTRICVGKEWHRFPSSFFVPNFDRNGRKVEMSFLQSEFRGLLPKQFENASTLIEKTRHEPSDMNDQNREEVSRYVDLNSCSYVIDADMPVTSKEPDFRQMPQSWKAIVSLPFIDASRSTRFFGLPRAFYVPYYSEMSNSITTYTLYRRL